jgi:ParB-like chromosome segregation protein Spo0J
MTIITWQEAKELEIHETAKAFPALLPEEFDQLKNNIAQHGVHEPVLINRSKDTLLDGVHRRKACVELKTEMPVEVYQGDDETGAIISRNLYRRHLTDDQRLALVTKLLLPELRAKAQERIAQARHRQMALSDSGQPIHAHVEIAKEAGVSQHKSRAAIALAEEQPEMLEQVEGGVKRLKDVKSNKRQPVKALTFEQKVWRRWNAFLQRWSPAEQQEVKRLVLIKFLEAGNPEGGQV